MSTDRITWEMNGPDEIFGYQVGEKWCELNKRESDDGYHEYWNAWHMATGEPLHTKMELGKLMWQLADDVACEEDEP